MPDLYNCLQSAMDGAGMDPNRGRAAAKFYKDLEAEYLRTMPPAAAKAKATRDVKRILAESNQRKRHVVLNQLQRMQANTALIAASDRPDLTLKSLLEYAEGRGDAFVAVRSRQDGLRRQFLGMMNDILSKHGRDILGRVREKAQLRNVVRELHGEDTGDVNAKQLAAAWREVAERARSLFNAHGGDIGRLADWGLPHTHDPWRMKQATRATWKDAIRDRLDWARIVDRETGLPFAATQGGRPADMARAEALLDDIYNNLTTGGWDDRLPSLGELRGRALYNQRADARVLHFRSADDWMEYNAQFGRTNPLDAMLNHVNGMSRDIALMQVLGPNPGAGLQHAIQTAQRRAALAGDADMATRVNKAGVRAQQMLDLITGAANTPESERFAKYMAGTRNLLAAAQLGSAIVSSATDLWTVRMAAKSIGLNPKNVLSQATKLAASPAERELAASMGYIADTLADAAAGASRYYQDIFASEITERVSGFVMRAQGLSFWTDMHRLAWNMEFTAELGRHAGKPLSDLPEELQALLRSRGIEDADWAALADPALLHRPAPGAAFLSPLMWRREALAAGMDSARAESLSIRLQAIIEEQLELAVPTRNLEATAFVQGSTRPGSISGEFWRSGLSYKGYPIALMVGQFRRAMAKPTPLSRAAYAASSFAGMTLLGALAVQMKEVVKGRDPRPMDNLAFMGAAVTQGGGLGIFGDFFSASTSRAGGGWEQTLAGPTIGFFSDVATAGVSNAKRALMGENTFVGRDVTNLARRYTPGTSLWYARLALDRLAWDQMQDLLDPEAQTQWRRQARKAARDYRTKSWWERGELAPERAPDLANIAGGMQ